MADIHLIGAERSLRPLRLWRTRLEEGTEAAFYGFRLRWNSRAHRWIFDLTSAVGTPIMLGRGVVTGLDLLADCSVDGRPPGQIFVIDESGQGRNPDRQGWQADFRMYYRPIADVLAAAGTSDEVR